MGEVNYNGNQNEICKPNYFMTTQNEKRNKLFDKHNYTILKSYE